MNPTPIDVRPRSHALAIDEADQSSSLELATSVAPSFGLKPREAREIVQAVARAVARWRTFATDPGITRRQIDRMATAFEHEDLSAALQR